MATVQESKSGEDMIKEGLEEARRAMAQDNFSTVNESDSDSANDELVNEDDLVSVYDSLSDIEKEAWDQGWRPLAEFLKAGHQEDTFVGAKEYIRYGNLQKKLLEERERTNALQSDFDDRFQKLNKFHEVKLKAERERLEKIKIDAVENADIDAYNKAQSDIDRLEEERSILPSVPQRTSAATTQPETQATAAPQESKLLSDWKKANPWITDHSDDRTIMANAWWNDYAAKNPGASEKQALEYVESKLRAKLGVATTQNPMRRAAAATDSGRQSLKKQSHGHGVTMANLTEEEREVLRKGGASLWSDKNGKFNEEKFLQSVADSRK